MSKKPNIRINKVYTRTGDSGTTRLVDQTSVLKSDTRVECYGEIDELNSSLGICISLLKNDNQQNFSPLIVFLKKIQNDLFNLGTVLATSDETLLEKFPKITLSDINNLEKKIDYYNKNLSELKSFILPSGNIAAAHFHLVRTICRRAERKCVALNSETTFDENVLKYLNRLSDFFFVVSRWINKQNCEKEDLWRP